MAVCRTQVTRPLARREAPGREVPATFAIRESPPASPNAPIRILRLGQVIEVTGLGKTKIYELQAVGQFPMRVQITAHTVGWVEHEVQAWLASRVATRSVPTVDPGREILRRPSR
jgi:prophage regulatory protein